MCYFILAVSLFCITFLQPLEQAFQDYDPLSVNINCEQMAGVHAWAFSIKMLHACFVGQRTQTGKGLQQ
jgi:hypothetical protein